MKVRPALAEAARRLESSSQTPRLDAELLMAHALDMTRERMLLACLDAEVPSEFDALIERRLAGEPVAYITGRRAFWTIELEVAPGVLIPRPDTETLIEGAVEHFRGTAGPKRILDLGTGPGSLLLAALDQWPQATGLGIERSEAALAIACRNAERLGLAHRAELRQGDWGEGLTERFNLILCNPPYVETSADLPRDVREWEPDEALFAGAQGLDDYRRLAPQIPRLLAPSGIACIEIGADQEKPVCALFQQENMDVSLRRDLAGRPRCLVIRP